MKSRLIIFFISILCLFFIVDLTRSIYSLWKRGDIVKQRQQVQDSLAQENQRLKDKLQQVESSQFIEQQARDKLNLQRQGEIVVVLPEELEATEEKQENEVKDLPNWLQWWQLFF